MGMAEQMSNSRRFTGAGRMTLIRHNDIGEDSMDPKDIYTSGRVVYGAISTGFTRQTTPLEDENSNFPAAIYTTGSEGTVAVVFNTNDPLLRAFLLDAKRTEEVDVEVWNPSMPYIVADDGTVVLKDPSGQPLKIGLSRPPLLRRQFSNTDYKMVDGPPSASGEFKVDPATSTITLHSSDKGASIFFSCNLIVPQAVVDQTSRVPKTPTYTLILSGYDEDHQQLNRMYVEDTYDSVQPSGDISSLPRQKAPGSTTVNFTTTTPRPGRAPQKTVYSLPLTEVTD